MLERTLTRRSVLEHAGTAAAGATGLGVADRAGDGASRERDPMDRGDDCSGGRVEPDVAVVGARRRDDDLVVRAGDAITFDASGTESAEPVASYVWTVGDESVDGERVHHAFERGGGVATVELAVTDEAGRTASASVDLHVLGRDRYDESPTPVHDASPARTYDDGYVVRAGEPVTFDARDSWDPDGDVVAYEWRFRRESRSGAVVEHAFRRRGNFRVTLSVTDDAGATESVEVPVHVTR
ncbi:PKD domain-containing protein [Halorubellus sp. PRR65]|uniref:PKD domain-containing protein n=1 Tax=Halorubellus sp. PRR65 TaxID=3098148 RepID=UPI002B26005D|nr:PKD domain-containing protein [Halorubellus sp. PRR65]